MNCNVINPLWIRLQAPSFHPLELFNKMTEIHSNIIIIKQSASMRLDKSYNNVWYKLRICSEVLFLKNIYQSVKNECCSPSTLSISNVNFSNKNIYQYITRANINSLVLNDAIWRHRSVSTLAQVMACCLIRWQQAITWTNIELPSKVFCGIYLRTISQVLMKLIHWDKVTLKCVINLGHHWFR